MLRRNVTLQDWEWDVPASELEDPNLYLGGNARNAFNEATVLQRKHQLDVGTTGNVLEVISPRIFRLSVRFQFN